MLVRLQIDRVEAFADGLAFGPVGSYVRMVGTAYGELDPQHPRNAMIVNLDKAPRNARGRVEYATDVYIMRPTEIARGNRRLLYEVNNRGRKRLLAIFHEARETAPGALNDPSTAEHAGNGFLFFQGYTLVWSGWDPDAPRAHQGLTLQAPVATEHGQPIVQTIRDEFIFSTRLPAGSLSAPLSYDAATQDQTQARLTVRAKEGDRPTDIPPERWAYATNRSIKLLPEGTPFDPCVIYDFWYPATNPKVLGIGYAATRDLLSFLRYATHDSSGNVNPVALSPRAPGLVAVLAYGNSQSGRYLRDHLDLGMNQDEAQRTVLDGYLSHVAGIGKVFTNYPFGQPNRTGTQHEDHNFPENWFPFAHTPLTDPLTGRTAGLCRGDGFDPYVMESNTSTEYWQKGASLLHTDPLGQRDLELPPTVRHYLIAGTQHGGSAHMNLGRGDCLYPRNPHNPAPALRALLVALDQWVTEGIEPPASRVPTIAAGTLTAAAQLAFPKLPEVQPPQRANSIGVVQDWVYPVRRPEQTYTPLVPQVDADGNELAGIRLPSIAAPLATYTGWNLYNLPGLEGELSDREGTRLPLALTRAARLAAGDPRLSLEERYGNHEGYVQRVRAVVEELLQARLLLPEDAARFVDEAVRHNPFAS
ncbi:MAG: alpha/beta hydrolase domain-containing protein [Candidatus Tectimicrobiota bacterium]